MSTEDSTANMMKGTLYFLSNVKTTKPLPSTIAAILQDVPVAGAAVQEYVQSANSSDVAAVRKEIDNGKLMDSDDPSVASAPSTTQRLLRAVIVGLKDLLARLVDHFKGEAADAAADWIFANAPQFLSQILETAYQHFGLASDIVSNIKKAAAAGHAFFKTRKLESGITSGQPLIVIEAVRDQIAVFGFEGLLTALEKALMAGITAANPAIGSVVGSVRTAFGFVIRVFLHFREVYTLTKIISEAKTLYADKLWEREAAFQQWYTNVISMVPIISCYCLAMPMTGSYFGFLSMTSGKGEMLSTAQLEKNQAQFEDVKVRAKQFVANHGVQLSSTDPMVAMSLEVANSGNIDLSKKQKK